jgi:hypothetical protein
MLSTLGFIINLSWIHGKTKSTQEILKEVGVSLEYTTSSVTISVSTHIPEAVYLLAYYPEI